MLTLSKKVVDAIRTGAQTAVLKDTDHKRWNVGRVHKVFHRMPMDSDIEPVAHLLIMGLDRIELGDVDDAIARKLGFNDQAEFRVNWAEKHRGTFYPDLKVWIIDVEIKEGVKP